jgi:hypothetical protein
VSRINNSAIVLGIDRGETAEEIIFNVTLIMRHRLRDEEIPSARGDLEEINVRVQRHCAYIRADLLEFFSLEERDQTLKLIPNWPISVQMQKEELDALEFAKAAASEHWLKAHTAEEAERAERNHRALERLYHRIKKEVEEHE